jgi:hypothetical protein
MTRPATLVGALIAAAGCVAVAGLAYHHNARRETTLYSTTPIASKSPLPTVDFLEANPIALKQATDDCQNATRQTSIDLCDRVHEADAGLLAAQYKAALAATEH